MPADVKTRFYTTERLGEKQSLTPEGFLLCMDVPIARTGQQVYGPGETPVVAKDGRVVIHREESEVFRPETIASFNGKPVVNEHPDGDVTPENWNNLAVGVVMNTRRAGDLLMSDLLITNSAAIKAIQEDGKRQVSCGYDADYVAEEGVAGVGYQKNIVGNHVALVDEARCGERCSIGDRQTTHDCSCKGDEMTRWERIVATVRDALPAGMFKPEHEKPLKDGLLKVMTADALAKDESEAGGTPMHFHVGSEARSKYTDEKLDGMFAAHDAKFKDHDDRLAAHDSMFKAHDAASEEEEKKEKAADEEAKKVEGDLEEEAPKGSTGDSVRKAKDSVFLEDAFIAAVASAEIIVPGISIPVFDRAAAPGISYKAVCGLRKKALQFAALDVNGGRALMLDGLMGGKTLDNAALDAMPCSKARDMFNALAALVRQANQDGNRSIDVNGNREHSTGDHTAMPLTLAELNKRNRARYEKR